MSNKHIYGDDFYDLQISKSLESAREVIPIILSYTNPKSVVDVGCGLGAWLSIFLENGVKDVFGMDGDYVNPERLLIQKENFLPRNLAEDATLCRKFDLVMSLEVAEHLPESSAKNFISALTSLGNLVLFSAAIPSQGGFYHVNEQWQSYWRELFSDNGFLAVDCIRERIWNNKKVQVCYKQNVFFYVAQEALNDFSLLKQEKQRDKPQMFDIVHPDMFKTACDQKPSLRQIVKSIPNALIETVSRKTEKIFKKK